MNNPPGTTAYQLAGRLDQLLHQMLERAPQDPMTEEAHSIAHDLAALLSPNSEIREVAARMWTCKARRNPTADLVDCDWPLCGCDPYADKVMGALAEMEAFHVK